MTWTLDRDTDRGKVRVLITGEAVEATAVFEDADIDVLLSIEGTVLRAAALGLERIAGDNALLLRKVRDADPTADSVLGGVTKLTVGSITLDGAKAAETFLMLAARYRAADADSDAGVEDDIGWAGMALDPVSHRDILLDDMRRRGAF
jgi:hypothetical protein